MNNILSNESRFIQCILCCFRKISIYDIRLPVEVTKNNFIFGKIIIVVPNQGYTASAPEGTQINK